MSATLAEAGYTPWVSSDPETCDGCEREMPAGTPLWLCRSGWEEPETDCRCRRCAFDTVHRAERFFHSIRRERPTVGFNWTILKSEKARRRSQSRYRRRGRLGA